MTTQETHRSLISGETGIVHVPVARAAAMRHTARKWPTIRFTCLARAGEHPITTDFTSHRLVPHGPVAIQFTWSQHKQDDELGVPLSFYQQAEQTYIRWKLLWETLEFLDTLRINARLN